jgi:hypothetical protein
MVADQNTAVAEADFFKPVGSFDPQRFEMVMRWAGVMAKASIIPEHLKGKTPDETLGNCFLVANQAATWGADPVSVAQCTSLVHGKLCYEGKLVDSVLQERYGVKLFSRYEGQGDTRTIYLSPSEWKDDGTTESIEIMKGTFGSWHTREKGGDVKAAWRDDPDGMLYNRGVRQWCRRYKPGVITGVYGTDEFDEEDARYRSERAKPITQSNPFADDKSKSAIENQTAPADRASGTSGASHTAPGKAAGASSRPEAPAVARSAYEELNKGLTHAQSADSLKKVWDKFFGAKYDPAPNETDKALAFMIYGLHQKRFKEGLDVKDASAASNDRIEEAYACSSS